MYQKFARALRKLHRGQRGMTGLETAIILIAFVTVASVLAYSVLSAGIFSAERGKETVYKGLESAQSTLEVKGSVLGYTTNTSFISTVYITLGLTIPNQSVDSAAIVFNYYDSATRVQGVTATSFAIGTGSTERGTTGIIEDDEQFVLELPVAANPNAYETFTVEIIPPTGATLHISRTVPAQIETYTDLK